jgi:hypothetical protein
LLEVSEVNSEFVTERAPDSDTAIEVPPVILVKVHLSMAMLFEQPERSSFDVTEPLEGGLQARGTAMSSRVGMKRRTNDKNDINEVILKIVRDSPSTF